jgi:hypothetical protein
LKAVKAVKASEGANPNNVKISIYNINARITILNVNWRKTGSQPNHISSND